MTMQELTDHITAPLVAALWEWLQQEGVLPAGGPVDGVTEWRGEIYVAQAGCIWVLRDDVWTLATEAAPPSFPPRKERDHG